MSTDKGLLTVSIDSRLTRLHLIHLVFNEIARQVDWMDIARKYVVRILRGIGLQTLPDRFPVDLEMLADANGLEHRALVAEFKRGLVADVYQDSGMSYEFRIAMFHLCLGQILQPNSSTTSHAPQVIRWFRGELGRISDLRDAGIFQKVSRSNARYLLASLAHAVRNVGFAGIFLSLDICRYLESNRFASRLSGYYYTPSVVIDLYEMLRQIVDEQGVLEGLFCVVWASPELVSNATRGLDRYQALKMRLIDDIHVRNNQNLLAPLVRL